MTAMEKAETAGSNQKQLIRTLLAEGLDSQMLAKGGQELSASLENQINAAKDGEAKTLPGLKTSYEALKAKMITAEAGEKPVLQRELDALNKEIQSLETQVKKMPQLQAQKALLDKLLADPNNLSVQKFYNLVEQIRAAEKRGNTAKVEGLKPERDMLAKILSQPELLKIISRVEGVDSSVMSKTEVVSEGFKKLAVQMVEALRAPGLDMKDSVAVERVMDEVLKAQSDLQLNPQQKFLVKELYKAFQSDANYGKFNLDPLQLTFLSRVLELHMLNFELHGKSNSLVRMLAGQEVMLLAMGGGKSAGVLSLELARELFKSAKGEAAPAAIYCTAADSLVAQIINEGPMQRMLQDGKLVVVGEDTVKDIISQGGFEPDKVYVMSNEGLKKIVLEMRGEGKSDAEIQKFFDSSATVAYDEFHSAFHTTDTILGSTGIWDYLPAEFKMQMRPLMQEMTETYVKVISVLGEDLAFNEGALCRVGADGGKGIFLGVESEPGSDGRNQLEFNLDYKVRGTGETLRAAFERLGIDIASDGNLSLLRKISQALYEKNGRELTGGVYVKTSQIRDASGNLVEVTGKRPWYGTAEKGMGKLNTIKGDPISSALTLIDIMFKSEIGEAKGTFDFENFNAHDFLVANPLFEVAVGEALAHVTTERVTMLEALEFLGPEKIVGYSGTLEGLSKTLAKYGKDIVAISPEPVIGFDLVEKGEMHLSFMLDGKMITLEGQGGKATIKLETPRSFTEHLLKRSTTQAEEGYSQQIYTHNDNGQLRGMAEAMAKSKGVSVLEITDATVKAFFDAQVAAKNPAFKDIKWGDD
jgi:hypothetical protein